MVAASAPLPIAPFAASAAFLHVRLPTLRRQPAYERNTEADPEQARARRPIGATALAIAAAMGALRATVGRTAVGAAALRARGASLAAAVNQITAPRHGCSAAQNAGLGIVHAGAAGDRLACAVSVAVGVTEGCAKALGQSVCPASTLARFYTRGWTELVCRRYARDRPVVCAAHVVAYACPVHGRFRGKARRVHVVPPRRR